MNDKERIVKLVQRRADVLLKCLHECKETMPMGKYLRKQAMYSTCLWLLEKINAMPNIDQKPTSDIRYEVKAGDSLSVNGKPFDYEKATITQKDFAPQQEWSKEDENRFQNIIACIEDCYNEKDAQDLIRWFKSLRHQPKQEWSEEDEEMAEDLIKGCVSSESPYQLTHTCKEIADWLKSLKNRVKGKEEKK